MITVEELRSVLVYDPESGLFRWNPRPRVRGGKLAGNVSKQNGYVRIGLGGRPSHIYQAHRLAWLYMNGEWPNGDIDHINGDRADNRWSNLRCVSRSINLQNLRKAKPQSKTGLLGVSLSKKRFSARIQVDGESKRLGTFDTAIEAHLVYLQAKRQLHEGCTI